MSRFFHYLPYGTVYVVILLILISFAYAWLIRPEGQSCSDGIQDQSEQGVDCGEACGKKCRAYVPLRVKRVWLIPEDEGYASVVVQVENQNKDAASKTFDYTTRFFDESGSELKSSFGSSFTYAGEVKNLVFYRVAVDRPLGRASLTIGRTSWVDAGAFLRPAIFIEGQSSTVTENGIRVEGKVINREPFALRRVRVGVLVYAENGDLRGVRETEFTTVSGGESHRFEFILEEVKAQRVHIEVVVSAARP